MDKNNHSTDPMEELVSYTAPCAPRGRRQDILAAVNGEFIRIRRGETVQIKRKFLEVLENAAQQEKALWQAQEDAVAQSGRALARL